MGPNKTDRNDARAFAQIMRTGWHRQIHVKSRPSRLCRSLLASRRTVLNEMRTIENVVRAVLREAGIKLGVPSRKTFAGWVRQLAGDDPTVMPLVEPLLLILATMLEQLAHLTKRVQGIARNGSGALGMSARVWASRRLATSPRDRYPGQGQPMRR